MGITLWREPSTAQRTDAWYARIAKTLRDTPSASLIVADDTDLRTCTARLLSAEHPVLTGHWLTTISQWLVRQAASPLPSPGLPLSVLITQDLMADMPLTYFTPSLDRPTLAAFLYPHMRMLLQSAIPMPQLEEIATHWGTERERDLVALTRTYHARLRDRWDMVDAGELGRLAMARMPTTAKSCGPLIVDLSCTHPIYLPLLRTLHDHGATVHAILPAETTGDPRIDDWMATCDALWATWPNVTSRTPSPDECRPAESHTLEIYRAASDLGQARWIVHRIAELIDAGAAPNRIGLLLTHPQQIPRYRRALAEYGLCRRRVAASSAMHSVMLRHLLTTPQWEQAPAAQPLQDWIAWCTDRLLQACPPESVAAEIRQESHGAWSTRLARELFAWKTQWGDALLAARTSSGPSLSQAFVKALIQQTYPPGDTMAALRHDMSIRCSHFHEQPHATFDYLFFPDAMEGNLPRNRLTHFFGQLPRGHVTLPLVQLRNLFPGSEEQFASETLAWIRWRAATTHFVASYAEADMQGRPQLPSHFLMQDTIRPADIPTQPPPVRRYTPRQAEYIRARVEREEAIAAHVQAAMPPAQILLRDPEVRTHIQQRFRQHTFSVTELQTVQACPFRYFAQYLLGIAMRPSDVDDVDHRLRGELAHALLATIYRRGRTTIETLQQQAPEALPAAIDALVDECLPGVLAPCEERLRVYHSALRSYTLATIRQQVRCVVLDDCAHWERLGTEAFLPIDVEWTFGRHGVAPLLLHADDGTPVAIRGTIDRIDSHAPSKECLVIDYKSGRAQSIRGEIAGGTHLQIPLYLLAIQQHFPEAECIGGLLIHLRERVRRHGLIRREAGKRYFRLSGRMGSSVTAEQWEELLTTSTQAATRAARQIRTGAIPWVPHTCAYCDWCERSRFEPHGVPDHAGR
ncbi:MAG: PD-(D/E)XK nuclease family protein [Deltaproteobacteria bacterium]|nr:PD-(D/E)XK nuclease family protein [Deltaproteobacteria bacterium]